MKKSVFAILLILTLWYRPSLAQDSPELVLPAGHTSGVLSLDFSPDGKHIVTGSADYTAKIWEIESGRLLHTFDNHHGWVIITEYNISGTQILTVSSDSTANLINAESGKLIRNLNYNSNKIITACFSPLGDKILCVDYDNSVIISDAITGKIISDIKAHSEQISSAMFSPDGKRIITSSWDNTVKIWDCESGKQLKIFKKNINRPVSAKFSPDGIKILITSLDNAATLWNAKSGKLIYTLKGSSEYVVYADFSPDGKKIIVNSGDKIVYVYDAVSGKLLYTLDDHFGRLYTVSFSPDSKNLLTAGSKNSYANVRNLETSEVIFTIAEHKTSIINAVYSPDGKYIATSANDNKVVITNAENGNQISSLEGKTDMSVVAFFCNDSRSIFTQSADCTCKLRDVNTGKVLSMPLPEFESVRRIRNYNQDKPLLLITNQESSYVYDFENNNIKFYIEKIIEFADDAVISPDGYFLAISNSNGIIDVVDTKSGKIILSIEGDQYQPNNFAFSIDSQNFIVAYQFENTQIYNLRTAGLIKNIDISTICNNPPAISPDGKIAAIPSWEYAITVFDIASGKQIYNLKSDSIFIDCAVFSPDGKKIISSKGDLWDIETGKLIFRVENVESNLRRLSFSEDGSKIIAICGQSARIWDTKTGKQLFKFEDHSGYVSNAEFSKDGRLVLTAATDGRYIIRNAVTGEKLYTGLQLIDGDWLAYDEAYRFDGTEKARDYLYFVCGYEIIDLDQVKDALYVPRLVEKTMRGQDINYPEISELDICGTMPLIERVETDNQDFSFRIQARSSNFEFIEVYVNDKVVYTYPISKLLKQDGAYLLNIKYDEISRHFINGMENKVEVKAIVNQAGTQIKSRGVSFKYQTTEKASGTPVLYIVMVGINTYKDKSLNLAFPAIDATELGDAIERSAVKLLGDTNVVIYNINSNVVPGSGYTTPEKDGIKNALAEIGKLASPNDIILLFFAGHGVMQGDKDKVFTLLTAETSPENQIGISTTELQSWLSFEGPHKILANKTILIFDACNSGQATKELVAMSRSQDETERIRQVEDLRDKSGFFILTASAPNQYAYEFPQYKHGLLTYCLLYVLKNNPDILDDGKFLNVQKWFLETESYLDILANEMGYQQDAQPFGTSNIRIGIVDEEVKQSINLAAEKPVVVCANVMNDDTFDDDLQLKALINNKLSEISQSSGLENANQRSGESAIIFSGRETENSNKINIRYQINGDKIECQVKMLKQGEILLSTVITGSKSDLNNLVSKICEQAVGSAK